MGNPPRQIDERQNRRKVRFDTAAREFLHELLPNAFRKQRHNILIATRIRINPIYVNLNDIKCIQVCSTLSIEGCIMQLLSIYTK